ncbi:MAG: aldo/keto reductase [Rhizobiaceae bacterium]
MNLGRMGMGTWALGGPFFAGQGWRSSDGAPLGYGDTDDRESTRAIHCALERGIRFFDTADAYGTGHAEKVLGAALKGHHDVAVATKFGNVINADRRELVGTDHSPGYIRRACEASLRRLGLERIDLYQLHLGDLPADKAAAVAESLEGLVEAELIAAYGWSTDDPERAASWANYPNARAIQFDMNVFSDAPEMLATCGKNDFVPVIRTPLAMGFLSGKFGQTSRLESNDIRSRPPDWLPYFDEGGSADLGWKEKLDRIRQVLASDGRTLVQGALAWIWARDAAAVPIPGMRTVDQVEENTAALTKGPLTQGQLAEIDQILNRA